MDRRSLLKFIAAATGTAFISGNRALAYEATPTGENHFDAERIRLMDEIAETIIPATDTPGAKDAGVGEFVTFYVSDCYDAEQQETFRDGLADIDALARLYHERDFVALDTSQKRALLDDLDRTAKIEEGGHYFTMMKQLVLFGFFTSEIGATEVLRYVAVPGRYDGNVDYAGEPAWATG